MSYITKIKSGAKSIIQNKKMLIGLIYFAAIVAASLMVYPLSIPAPKIVGDYEVLELPSAQHPLGTDTVGNDMVADLLYGIQTSLQIGFIAGTIGVSIGLTIALIAGYKGGKVDDILRSIIDIFLVIPTWPILVLLVVVIQAIPIYGMAFILGILSWQGSARAIRAQVLSLKERDFIDLAKISGSGTFEIVFKEILPNMIPYVALLYVGASVGNMMAEVGLGVIGLTPQYVVTLGYIYNKAVKTLAVIKGWWWWVIPPTLILMSIFLSLYIITTGLDEISNPRLKKITGE